MRSKPSRLRLSFGLLSVLGSVAALSALFFAVDAGTAGPSPTRYQHDPQGRLISRTTRNGRVIRYHRDPAGLLGAISYHHVGRLSGWTYPAARRVRFGYDLAGNRVSMMDAAGLTRYEYDDSGLVRAVTAPDGKKLSYEYDPWGRVRARTMPDGRRATYEYDLFDRIRQVKTGVGSIRYQYELNRVTRILPNGISSVFDLSNTGRVSAIEHRQPDGRPIAAYRYEHDADGRVAVFSETTPQGTLTTRYAYDPLGRLRAVAQPDGSTITYEYDAMGNRVAQAGRNGTTRYSYDAEGRLLNAGKVTFAYDAAGNLASREADAARTSYSYDEDNRLIEARTSVKTIRYGYDGDGNLAWREADGKRTTYISELLTHVPQVVAEQDGSGSWSNYIVGSSRVGRASASGDVVYFLEGDLGSTRYVVNQDCTISARYAYSPFGAPTLADGDSKATFLFSAEQWDPDAHLLYLRARYYDPEVGRFLSVDPLHGTPAEPASFNRYTYAGNDPINRVDPLGLQPTPPPSVVDSQRRSGQPQPAGAQGAASSQAVTVRSLMDFISRGTFVGTQFGEDAAERYAQRFVQTGNWLYTAPGLASSLWTPDTWKQTALTLAAAPGVAKLIGGAVDAGVDSFLARSIQPLSRREPIHTWIVDKFIHYGVDIERGEHVGVGLGAKALLHFYEDHINIGGARGWDVPVDWRTLAVVAQGIPEGIRRWVSDLSDGSRKSDNDSRSAVDGLSDRTRSVFLPPPPRPPGGGGPGVPAVGGVYLDQTARIIGELGAITGAMYDRESGRVILVGDKNTALPPMKPEYLAAAIRAVYSESPHEPGMTIDPNPQDPHASPMHVIFFGRTEHTRLGWVMFEADRVMKGYSIGADNLTKQPVTSAVPDYRSVTAMGLAEPGRGSGLWSRFWLVPDPIGARVNDDGSAIVFDRIKMRVRTETMQWAGGRLVPAGEVKDPHAEAFADHFTRRYGEFARENPIYGELAQVAQAVALAKWMKEQNIPADWSFVRAFAGEPYPTPETTPAAYAQQERRSTEGRVTRTLTVATFGGVEMIPRLQPRLDTVGRQFREEVARAWLSARGQESSSFSLDFNGKRYQAVALAQPNQRELAGYELALTDLRAVDDELSRMPGLGRYYSSFHNEATEFGHAWSLALPRLEFEAVGEKNKAQYLSVEGDPSTRALVQRFRLTNAFGLGEEEFVEHSVDQGLRRIRFAPTNPASTFRGIYAEGAGAYRLFFKNDNQALFDSRGRLRAMLTPRSKTLYDYDPDDHLTVVHFSRGRLSEEVRFEYDDQHRIRTCTAASGRKVAYGYDDRGNLLSVETGGHKTRYEYDSRRLLTEVATDDQTLVQNRYDSVGRLVEQRGGVEHLEQAVQTTAEGRIVTRRDGRTAIRQSYDRQLRLTGIDDDRGYSQRLSYDGTGRVARLETTLPTGGRATLDVSADRRQVIIHDPRGVPSEYRYSAGGQLVEVLSSGRTTAVYKYDLRGNIADVTYPGQGAEQYIYDERGLVQEVRRITTGDGERVQAVTLVRDADGELVGVTDSTLGQVRWTSAADRFTVTEGTRAVSVQYDDDRRLRRAERSDGSVVVYTYAPNGALRTIEETRGGRTATVEVTGANAIVRRSFSGGQTRYRFNAAGLLASVQDPLGALTTYSYNPLNQLQQVQLPNSACLEYLYDAGTGLPAGEGSCIAAK